MRTIILAAALAVAAGAASAQPAWPARQVTVIVPFAAGGPTDVVARLYAQAMAGPLGQTVLIENVGGAGGTIGVLKAARAAPDGYTLLVGNIGTQAANMHFYKTPKYDSVAEFEPIANLADVPQVLVARKDFPADDLKSFVAYNRANAATLKYGSAGIGVSSHLGGLLMNMAMGTNVVMIPYRGTAPAMTDLLAGVIDWMSDQSTTTVPQIRAGAVKPLAVLSPARNPALPEVPTAKEQGFDVEVVVWNALFAPKGVAPEIVATLWSAVRAARQDPTVRDRLATLGGEINSESADGPDGLASRLAADIAKWGPIIRESGFALD